MHRGDPIIWKMRLVHVRERRWPVRIFIDRSKGTPFGSNHAP